MTSKRRSTCCGYLCLNSVWVQCVWVVVESGVRGCLNLVPHGKTTPAQAIDGVPPVSLVRKSSQSYVLSTAPFSARSGHTWKGRCVPSIGGRPPRPHSHRPPHEDDASGRRARVGASTALRRAWQAVWAKGRNRPKRGTCTPTRLCARCSDAPTRCLFSDDALTPGSGRRETPNMGC